MDLKVSWLLTVLLICSSNNFSYAKMSISEEEDFELERQLKVLNKPPVKTILTDEGETIDCINIYKQPAFDHPLLNNHKLQLKPSSFPVGSTPETSSKIKSAEIRFMKEACPTGTVPIKRTLKEDLLRTKSLFERPSNISIGEDVISGSHVISVAAKHLEFPYYGATARVAIYDLSIAPDQSSSTNIWIESGPPEELNFITTGWKVSQRLNGDGLTRLFTYWTPGNGYKTGCYNTLCPGFVVTNKEVGPNVPLGPTSIRGVGTHIIKLLIFQDRQTGNWWLSISERDVVIGYWPKELFTRLSNGAKRVAWGRETHVGQNGISPPMGNGFKPDHHYNDTCYFRQVRYINDQNAAISPLEDQVTEYVDKSGCYDLENDGDWGSQIMGYAFMFGGPGGNCGI